MVTPRCRSHDAQDRRSGGDRGDAGVAPELCTGDASRCDSSFVERPGSGPGGRGRSSRDELLGAARGRGREPGPLPWEDRTIVVESDSRRRSHTMDAVVPRARPAGHPHLALVLAGESPRSPRSRGRPSPSLESTRRHRRSMGRLPSRRGGSSSLSSASAPAPVRSSRPGSPPRSSPSARRSAASALLDDHRPARSRGADRAELRGRAPARTVG